MKKRVVRFAGTLALVAGGFIGANVYASLQPSCAAGGSRSIVHYTNPSFSVTFCSRDVRPTLSVKLR